MKWGRVGMLSAALLAATPGLTRAQDPASGPPAKAFQLTVQAPAEIQDLLERHLELQRYRELPDLSDNELARLLTAAEKDARELMATLGYFSPEIKFDQQIFSTGLVARQINLSVVPGAPTVVGEVKIEFKGPISDNPTAQSQRGQIESNWLLRSGMRFTQTRWAAAKQQALRQLTTQRYPTGQLSTTLADIDPVTRSAQLTVTLDSGPAYQLGGLVI